MAKALQSAMDHSRMKLELQHGLTKTRLQLFESSDNGTLPDNLLIIVCSRANWQGFWASCIP